MNTSSVSYSLQIRHLVRGRGKIFCSLELVSHKLKGNTSLQNSLPQDFSCVVRAHTAEKTDRDLPCELIDDTPLEQLICPVATAPLRSWVCVLAILDISQTLDICIYQKDTLVLTKRASIHPRYASYLGKYHSVIHNARAEHIRNIDARGITGGSRIDLLAVRPKKSCEEITLYLRTPCLVDEASRLDIRIYSQDGTLLSKDIQILSERFSPASGISQYGEQVAIVGAKIPQQSRGICVWARRIRRDEGASADMYTGVDTPSSHVVFEDFYLAHIRSQSLAYVSHAAENLMYPQWLSQHTTPPADRYIQQVSLAIQKQETKTDSQLALVIYAKGHTPSEIRATYLSCMRQTIDVDVICVCTRPQAEPLSLELDRLYTDKDVRARIHVLCDDETKMGIAHTLHTYCNVACTHIGCIEAGDIIEDDCVYWYMSALLEHPDVAFVYADEDVASLDATATVASAHHPFFKPDFDAHLLRTCNYTAHMFAVRVALVDTFQNTCSYPIDLFSMSWCAMVALMCAERGQHAHHIPRVLYHASYIHEALQGDTSAPTHHKDDDHTYASVPYAKLVDALVGTDTVDFSRHFERAQTKEIEERITWKRETFVSIIIPTKDNADVLLRCVRSIYKKSTWHNFEVVIVENNSEKAHTFEVYKELKRAHTNLSVVVCEMGGVFNFSHVVNAGAQSAQGDYLLFLNNDTEVITPNWIERLCASAQEKTTGIVGAKLLFPNDTIQHAGVVLGANLWSPQHLYTGYPADSAGYAHINTSIHEMHAVTGACMMMKKEVFNTLGGFDETLPVNFNDTDLCLRARAHGLVCVQRNDCVLYHHESVSRGHADNSERLNRLMFDFGVFWTRWKDKLSYPDPCYSRNFGYNNIYCGLDVHR